MFLKYVALHMHQNTASLSEDKFMNWLQVITPRQYSFVLHAELKNDMPAHVVGVCVYSLKYFYMWGPIVQLCALDSVLAFWQTHRNFKFMTTILNHPGGGETRFARIQQPCSAQRISENGVRRWRQSKVGKSLSVMGMVSLIFCSTVLAHERWGEPTPFSVFPEI